MYCHFINSQLATLADLSQIAQHVQTTQPQQHSSLTILLPGAGALLPASNSTGARPVGPAATSNPGVGDLMRAEVVPGGGGGAIAMGAGGEGGGQ
jgi:hypothetical protein